MTSILDPTGEINNKRQKVFGTTLPSCKNFQRPVAIVSQYNRTAVPFLLRRCRRRVHRVHEKLFVLVRSGSSGGRLTSVRVSPRDQRADIQVLRSVREKNSTLTNACRSARNRNRTGGVCIRGAAASALHCKCMTRRAVPALLRRPIDQVRCRRDARDQACALS